MSRVLATALLLGLAASAAHAYPLDGYPATGITRLEAYRLATDYLVQQRILTRGGLLPMSQVQLRLLRKRPLELPAPDPELTARLVELIGDDAPAYGVALLDFTDPDRLRYAAHNPNQLQQPGSVGKIVVALGWFQALADVYPDDVDARNRLLFDTQIVANEFIRSDHHEVPLYKPGDARLVRRPIEEGDRANLWTYLDWMCSASSNAAASMLISHLLLFKHFGTEYPVPSERAVEFFARTPKPELTRLLVAALEEPLVRNGLDPRWLRQGSLFTRQGKARVPGAGSHATPQELLRYMFLLEQGRLVDAFSSRETKRLLYLTDQRIRYASSPALDDFAVYFKSGSLYGCKPEPGFECGKYRGNRMNYMNSVTSVESTDSERPLQYIAVVLSNVLRKNSAEQHQWMAGEIHEIIESFHRANRQTRPTTPPD